MKSGHVTAPQTKAERVWDWALKGTVPVALILGGLIASHDNSIRDHESRIGNVEREILQRQRTLDRMLETLGAINIQLGRLDERVANVIKRLDDGK